MPNSLTDAQRECIESREPRLVVSAAAGTGKTFTLTQKISWALRNGQIDGIDQVLAITFTNKAAAEIKARVRSTLRAAGMHSQALLVDGAWISTIHGMCSRILRAHALEAGVDPGFEVADERTSDELLQDAIERALGDPVSSQRYGSLFGDFDALSSGYGSTSVEKVVKEIIVAAKSSPDGFDSLCMGPEPASPDAIARRLLGRLDASVREYEGCGCNTSRFESGLLARRSLRDALSDAVSSGDVDLDGLARILDAEEHKLAGMSAKALPGIVEMFEGDRLEWRRACSELRGCRSRKLLEDFIDLSRVVKEIYDQLKEEKGLLDNDDLMVLAYGLLASHPEIADGYREQFKLIMVDEFQDTSQLQIDIISLIAGPDAQLCTVGDAQQSIYGFRGADVNVYDKYIEDVGAEPVKLDTNFRSHGDVLEFANRVFEQPGVFGDRFLYLHEGRQDGDGGGYGIPRVQVLDVQGSQRSSGTPEGVGLDQIREYSAAAIADGFSRYREHGCDPGDMVLLLGKMSNVDVYADALRSRGFEVVIAGGSGFWSSDEAVLVSDILGVLADPHDTMSLYGLLASGLVPIGVDDMAELVAGEDGRHRDLDRGLEAVGEGSSPELRFLKHLVDDAVDALEYERTSVVVGQMLSDSGYVDRLRAQGAQGSSAYANIVKAIRFISDYEDGDHLGVSRIASVFSDMVEKGGKEAPGVLMSGGSEAVRIMTIHASKGLEFPVVAVAEFTDIPRSSGFVSRSYRGRTYLALTPGRSFSDYGVLSKAADDFEKGAEPTAMDRISDADGYAGFVSSVKAFDSSEQLGESKRRFYVALTRASEGVVVCIPDRLYKSGLSKGSIPADICTAFFPSAPDEPIGFPDHVTAIDLGCGREGEFRPVRIECDAETGDVACVYGGVELVEAPAPWVPSSIPAACDRKRMVPARRRAASAAGMFSYSSISPYFAGDGYEGAEMVYETGDDQQDYTGAILMQDEDDATELGLAFHATAEYMALGGYLGGRQPGEVEQPSSESITAIVSGYNLTQSQFARYMRALNCWVSCSVAHRAASYPVVMAEVPFCIVFPTPDGVVGAQRINGEIDLLCADEGLEHVFVVDYKTGGGHDARRSLRQKHLLQSLCYAYAVLTSGGAEDVELDFVRVEQLGSDGEPQVISYRYDRGDLPVIEAWISSALKDSISAVEC